MTIDVSKPLNPGIDIQGGFDDEVLVGTAGDDFVNARSGMDDVSGLGGDDEIYGGGGDDIVNGGTGDDFVSGGRDSDTYVFKPGDGIDFIDDTGSSGTDTLLLHTFLQSEVIFGRNSKFDDELVISFTSTSDQITIDDALGFRPEFGIEEFVFDGGLTLTAEQVRALVVAASITSGDDEAVGTGSADTLEAGTGNDLVSGLGGDDLYVFNRGDGQDTLDDDGGGFDTLEIVGYAPGEVQVDFVTVGDDDLLLTFSGTSDQIVIRNTLANDSFDVIEEIRFEDNTIWTQAMIVAELFDVLQTDGDDIIFGFNAIDILEGGLGDDFLSGGGFSDLYIFSRGDGMDTIEEDGDGNATDQIEIRGYLPTEVNFQRATPHSDDLLITFDNEPGDSILVRNTLNLSLRDRIEEVLFDDGSTMTIDSIRDTIFAASVTSGDDVILGTDLDNVLAGGLGDDFLSGRDGSDVYTFANGDGADIIDDAGLGDVDQLVITGYASTDIILNKIDGNDSDLVIRFAGTNDSILLKNALKSDANGQIEEVSFDDGITLTSLQLQSMATNVAPVAVEDNGLSIIAGNILTIDPSEVLLNDIDSNGDTLTVIDVGTPVNGTVNLGGDGTISFVPSAGFEGAASFNYRISDGQGGESETTVFVNVLPANNSPELVDQVGDQAIDDGALFTFDVSTFVTDPDGDQLTYSATGLPANLTIDAQSGIISGTAAASASQGGPKSDGVYGVTVTAADGDGETIDFDLNLVAFNASPVAEFDEFETSSGVSIVGNVLTNDVDSDGDLLAANTTLFANPTGGTVVLQATGEFNYTPNVGFSGIDSFVYTLVDSDGASDIGVVAISVIADNVNQAPVTIGEHVGSIDEDVTVTIAAATLLANDTDIDGDILTITAVQDAVNGSVALDVNGDVVFTPAANYNGPASFSYTASDGELTSTATVTLTVNPVNDAPVATGEDVGSTDEDVAVTIAAATLLANDTDIDGDALTITSVQDAVNGSVALDVNGDVVFTPDADYNGPASFSYTASDGELTSTAMVTLTVNPVNDAPVAVSDGPMAGTQFSLISISPADLIANDLDVDGDALTVVSVQDAQNGAVFIGNDNNIYFAPDDDFTGVASFNYTVTDPSGETSAAIATLQIDPITGGLVYNGGDGKDSYKGGDGVDIIFGNGGVDKLNGEDGDDFISGGTEDDALEGKAGDDILLGGDGDDELKGGDGQDTLIGGAGDDKLDGGENSDDTFIFRAGFGNDEMIKFAAGAGSNDVMEFQGFGDLGFADIIATAEDADKSVILHITNQDSIFVKDVKISELHEDDFNFV